MPLIAGTLGLGSAIVAHWVTSSSYRNWKKKVYKTVKLCIKQSFPRCMALADPGGPMWPSG